MLLILPVVIPGSQRASLPLPQSTRTGEHKRPVTRIPMKAGDVLVRVCASVSTSTDNDLNGCG